MPRELRVRISLAVPLPDDPTRLAQRILAVDGAIDELRTATGGAVESESEIVTPRVKVREQTVDGAPVGALYGAPTVEVPPMDPAPTVVGPAQAALAVSAAYAAAGAVAVKEEDLLEIPKFLDRRGNLNPEPSQDISQ